MNAIIKAWSAETSNAPNEWTPANPAWGQCAVTALLVQDLLGGVILRDEFPTGSHCFNRLGDGTYVDLTREQFDHYPSVTRPTEERTREYLLANDSTARRYSLLRRSVAQILDFGSPAAPDVS